MSLLVGAIAFVSHVPGLGGGSELFGVDQRRSRQMQKSGLSYLAIDRNVEASFDVLNTLVRGVVLPLQYKQALSIDDE